VKTRLALWIACMVGGVLPTVAGTVSGESPAVHTQAEVAARVASGIVRLSEESIGLADVKTAEAQQGTGRAVLKAMGRIVTPEAQMAIVSYSFPGRVTEVHAKVGDWVERGQNVIVLESQDVGEAKSDFVKAMASLELAKVNRDIEERLLKDGTSAKRGLLTAEAEFKLAQVTADAAERKLHVLGFSEERVKAITTEHEINPTVTLTAPISGKVALSKAILGGMVDESTEILTIVDPRRLWTHAEVFEKDLAKVKVGQNVEIVVPAYPGEVFRGTVSHIGDLVNEDTRTITVRTEVANEDLRLKPGMFADVSILRNGTEPIVLVPSAAVLDDGRQKIVFVKQQDGFVRREIETNVVEGELTQIVSGLVPGEVVVVQGNHQLRSELQRGLLEASHTH